MDIQYRIEKKDYREGGIHLLSLRLCHVELSGEESYLGELTDFYESWLSAVQTACEGDLLSRLREAYMADPSPRKRFTHRPCVLACVLEHEYTAGHPRRRRSRSLPSHILTLTRRTDMTQDGETRTLSCERDRIELTYGGFLS